MKSSRKRWIATVLLALCWTACNKRVPKTTRQVKIPPAYLAAQEAGREELVEIVNTRYASIGSLAVSDLSLRFQGGSRERGYFEKYPKARAYFVTQRPDRIFVNILNPVTKSTLAAMASDGGSFQIWVPRDNKYLTGRTEARIESENPLYQVRPVHLIQAILVEPIPSDDPSYRYFVEEEQDQNFKYYVLGLVRLEAGSKGVELTRRVWFERSSMNLVRQQYYDGGATISTIRYRKPMEVVGKWFHAEIDVERNQEHYEIQMQLNSQTVKLDRMIAKDTFSLPRPPGAEILTLSGDEPVSDNSRQTE